MPEGFKSIAILKEGDSFGEQSFLNDARPSLSSVVTLDYCELMKLKRSDFQMICQVCHVLPWVHAHVSPVPHIACGPPRFRVRFDCVHMSAPAVVS